MRDLLQALQRCSYEAYQRDLFTALRLRAHPATILALSVEQYCLVTRYHQDRVDTPIPRVTAVALVGASQCVPLAADTGLPLGYVVAEAHLDCRVWRLLDESVRAT